MYSIVFYSLIKYLAKMILSSSFLNTVKLRGYFHQCTNMHKLDKLMSSNYITAYIGFDCTAKSLHIGSLMQIMVLRYLQKFGHKPIVLVGGGTTKIGDPSGKDKSRTILNNDEIIANKEGIKNVLKKFISFGNSKDEAIFVDNAEWLDELNYIDFLRSFGCYFSINRMLTFDSIKMRLEREQNLSFLEFNYMLLQAYDFIELYKRYNCILQIGGSDQWGNIINGIELGRKLNLKDELLGLTTPLLLNNEGQKMGKTASGAVWLDDHMYSPYDYWQYFRNIEDQYVGKFLRLFTNLNECEINELENLSGKEINEAKKILATEATKICHGQEVAEQVQLAYIKSFECNDPTFLPTIKISREKIVNGITIMKLLLVTNLVESGGEARRLIKSECLRINDCLVNDINEKLLYNSFDKNDGIKVSIGKKKHFKILIS